MAVSPDIDIVCVSERFYELASTYGTVLSHNDAYALMAVITLCVRGAMNRTMPIDVIQTLLDVAGQVSSKRVYGSDCRYSPPGKGALVHECPDPEFRKTGTELNTLLRDKYANYLGAMTIALERTQNISEEKQKLSVLRGEFQRSCSFRVKECGADLDIPRDFPEVCYD